MYICVMGKDRRVDIRISGDLLEKFDDLIGPGQRSRIIEKQIKKFIMAQKDFKITDTFVDEKTGNEFKIVDVGTREFEKDMPEDVYHFDIYNNQGTLISRRLFAMTGDSIVEMLSTVWKEKK